MEFEGKEYSEELLEKLKQLYLTVPAFNSYPIKKELGITMPVAKRLVDLLLPKVTLSTVEDVWELYKKYPDTRAFGRMARTKAVVDFVLETVITKDQLQIMYREKNLFLEDIIEEMGLPPFITKKGLKYVLDKHNLKRKEGAHQINSARALREKYKDPEAKRITRDKIESTNMRKRGVKHAMHDPVVRAKQRATTKEHWGVENAMQNKDVYARMVKTTKERWGVEVSLLNPEVHAKSVATSNRNWGTNNPLSSEKMKKQIRIARDYNFYVKNRSQVNIKFTPTPYVKTKEHSSAITKTPEALRDFLRENFPEQETFTFNELSKITGKGYNSIAARFSTSLDFVKRASMGVIHEDMLNFLLSLGYIKGVDFLVNDRQAIKPREIDFYFPKQKVGIEVNDLGTHNSTVMKFGAEPKPKNYHMEKSLKAKEQGIRLIHAWEHYFNNPQQYEVLKNAIKHALGISMYRVYARNTYVKEVPNVTLKDFFNTNNIQGFRGAKTAYALFDKKTDEVLMAYSVGASHFAHNKYDMELIRGASKLDTTIVGGASKLWKFIIDSNPEVNSIVYYIDRNIYNGSSIGTLEGNLELVSTQVGFWNYFVDTGEMKNRQPAKHKEIKELVAQGKVWEVYNAGTETYVWTRG